MVQPPGQVTLSTKEFPGFGILIGRNGTGKTQVLDALKEGLTVIPSIEVSEIELYDMVSSRTPQVDLGVRLNFICK